MVGSGAGGAWGMVFYLMASVMADPDQPIRGRIVYWPGSRIIPGVVSISVSTWPGRGLLLDSGGIILGNQGEQIR